MLPQFICGSEILFHHNVNLWYRHNSILLSLKAYIGTPQFNSELYGGQAKNIRNLWPTQKIYIDLSSMSNSNSLQNYTSNYTIRPHPDFESASNSSTDEYDPFINLALIMDTLASSN